MGKCSVPEDIRKAKPRGTAIKPIHGTYYVYEQKAKKLKSGKWGAKTGKIIGKITPDGVFVPNSERPYTVLEYGAYRLAEECSKEIFSDFTRAFGTGQMRIWVLALIYAVNGFRPISLVSQLYRSSMMSVRYPDLKMGETAVANLLDDLGRKTTEEREFEKLLAKDSAEIAVDGHVIQRYSKLDGMTEYGYKYHKLGSEQVNLLTAFDTGKGRPIMMRMFDGSKTDKVSVMEMIGDMEVRNCLFLFDRGFYSKDLKTAVESKDSAYIMPLSENLLDYKNVISSRGRGRLKTFLYEHREGIKTAKDVVEYQTAAKEDGKTRVILYRNKALAAAEESSFLEKMDAGVKGYDKAGLAKASKAFGVIVLETTKADATEKEIYGYYKDRWDIETYFDYLKHQMDFNALGVHEWSKLSGLSFMMLLSTLIRCSVEDRLKASELKGTYMPEVILAASSVKAVRKNEGWSVENASKNERRIFDGLKATVGDDIETYVPQAEKTEEKAEEKGS